MNKSLDPKKSEAPRRPDEKQVNPAVKAWLQNVIVPAMVKQYMESKPKQIEKEEQQSL
jgi:hypothetical protein